MNVNFRKFQSNSTYLEALDNGYENDIHKKTLECQGFYGTKNPTKLYSTSNNI